LFAAVSELGATVARRVACVSIASDARRRYTNEIDGPVTAVNDN
jgi:hypothetical protein